MARRRKAKAGSVNKSQAIRDAVGELGGKARPRDVIAHLSERGVEVSPALVTNVITRNRGRAGRKAGRPKANGRSNGGGDVSMSALLEAKRLVAAVGSTDEAKRAIDALSRLLN